MKVILQRVSSASVAVDEKTVSEIGSGLMLLCGFGQEDTESVLEPMAKKVANMRIFANEEGRFDRSVLDVGGEILAVPQFTLYADTSKGRRPEFFGAMKPADASRMFDSFCEELEKQGVKKLGRGVFGAMMAVSLTNDGPVTISLENSVRP